MKEPDGGEADVGVVGLLGREEVHIAADAALGTVRLFVFSHRVYTFGCGQVWQAQTFTHNTRAPTGTQLLPHDQ